MGGSGDGLVCGFDSVVYNDGGAQEIEAAAEGGRHAGRVSHTRRGGVFGGITLGLLRGANPLQLFPPRSQPPGCVLRRRRRQAARQADRGRALRHWVEHRRDEHNPERHQTRDAAPHGRGPPPDR